MDTRKLAQQLTGGNVAGLVTRHQGVVTAVGAGSLTLRIDGSAGTISGIRYLNSYTPTLNDTVEILVDDTDIIVLGKLA